MVDAMQGLVYDAKKSRFSAISADLSDSDVVSVWENVSTFIEKQMSQQKGVNIPGLGIFTFSQKKLDVGNNKFILIQRPVFVLSERFAQTHGLNYTKHHVTGQIPVVQLNFAALSVESPFDRDTVEACVKEVLGALARSVAFKKNVEFTFTSIGRLQVRDSKVKMKFYKEFVNSMDGSGRMLDTMKDRPGTVDSVMSERPESRPGTGTLFLPRISQGNSPLEAEGIGLMPAIQEECAEEDDKVRFADEVDVLPPADENADMGQLGDQQDYDAEATTEPNAEEEDGAGGRLAAPVAKATGISFSDDLILKPVSPKGGRIPSVLSNKPGGTPMLAKRSLSPLHGSSCTPRVPPLPDDAYFNRSKSMDYLTLEKLKQPTTPLGKIPSPPLKDKPASPPGSSCGHHNAGQELCYLCHQRDRRNIPVSFAEERRRREQEEDKLLQQYQHMNDTEAMLDEQEHLLGRRHDNQKMAAFNLGVAEAVKCKKTQRPIDFHPSYIFQKRPLTPPRYIKQELLHKDLAQQVSAKDSAGKKRKADEEFLERLEQVQLADDLAVQREQYLKEKSEQQEQYKRALSAQIHVRDSLQSPSESSHIRADKKLWPLTLPRPTIILPFSQTFTMKIQEGYGNNKRVLRYKPLPMPGSFSDSSEPVFGKNDMNNEKMAERRRRSHELYREQLMTVEQRKREAILKKLQEQKEEEQMLQRTNDELLDDRAKRYERLFNNRKTLETDWSCAAETKKVGEAELHLHNRSAGMLLHEQCDKYRRCGQCKRRLMNCGESHIWRESRYIPGSRLMV